LKKFSIATTLGARVINANEYSLAPKTNNFSANVKGNSEFAAFTSVKGKSAVANYYLYFKESGVLYYFRSSPEEIEAAKKLFVVDDEKEIDRLTEAEKGPVAAEPEPEITALAAPVEIPVEAPKTRRERRAAKA